MPQRIQKRDKNIRSFKIDYTNGTIAEKEVLRQLKKINEGITKLGKYHPMDFKLNEGDKKYYFEQKTRFNCDKDTYRTTLMPKNKLDFLKNHSDYKGVFLFKYGPETYFVNVENLIEGENFYFAPFKRKPRVDYNDKEKMYLHIDVDCLTHINNLIL